MQRRVYDRLEGNTVFYTLPEVTTAINMSFRTVNAFSGFYQKTVPVPLTIPNRFFYDLPDPVLIPLNVNYQGRALQKEHIKRLGSSRRNILRDANRSGPKYWLPIGLKKIMISPADSIGGKFFEVQGICQTPELVNLTDTVVIADEWTEIIEEDAFRFLTLKESGAVFTSAARLFMKWGPRVRDLAMWINYRSPKFFVEKDSSK